MFLLSRMLDMLIFTDHFSSLHSPALGLIHHFAAALRYKVHFISSVRKVSAFP